MAPAIAFIILAVIVVAVIVVAVGKNAVQRADRDRAAAEDPKAEQLRYVVPAGHDPAAVVAALQKEGYTCIAEQSPDGGHVVLVACDTGADRERARVRSTIQHGQSSELEVPPVHFADEQR